MIGAELQASIYAVITGSPVVAARCYDQVPPSPTFPYVTIGDEQTIDDGNTCEDGWLVYSDVHVWDRPATGDKATLKGIVKLMVPAVTGITSVSGFRVIAAELESSRTLRDPDGKTEHAILTFRFLIDPA